MPPALAPFEPYLLPAAISSAIVLFVLWRMRPRTFYFIRHGETLLNVQHVRQGAEGALSPLGRAQAEKAGAYFKAKRFPIKRIMSSSYERAQETAHIIAKELRVPVVVSPLLAERRNPSEVIGKSTHDPEVRRITDQMDLGYHTDDYRFSDEESFDDIKVRARKCLALLSRQSAGDTIVVTHHHFLKMLLAYVSYRDRLHASDFIKLSFFNFSDNARISICKYNPWKAWNETRGWTVLSYNEEPK